MAKYPAIPLWTDAYLSDTGHLTTIEHGAYLLLLMTMWRSKNQRIVDDDRVLARITRTTLGQWKRMRPNIQPFFSVEKHVDNCVEINFWTQGRLTDEYEAVRQRSKKQSSCVRSRWMKNKETPDTMVIPDGYQNDTSHIHNHNNNNPPTPLGQEDLGFDIFDLLSERGKADARAKAPDWDLRYLADAYNAKGKPKPDFPDKAFAAFCAVYTRGLPPGVGKGSL